MELPPDWRDVPLASVAEVRLGRQRSPKNHAGDQMRPYVRAANVSWSGLRLDDVKEMNFTDSEMDTFRLKPGDLLLGEASGSPSEVGKPALWRGEIADCAFQNTLVRVRPRGPDPEYLLHYFRHQAMSGRFAAAARGVGIHHLGSDALAKWRLPLPPMSEQRRIAEVLDRADALRVKRRRTLALLDGLTQSIFHDMFGDPLLNRGRWPHVSLVDLCHCYSGATPSTATPANWVGPTPWFSPKDIKQRELFDAQDHIDTLAAGSSSMKVLPANMVVMVVRGMILAHTVPISILRVPATVNQDLKALIPRAPIEPDFLAACLRAQAGFILGQVSTAAHGTKRLDEQALRAIQVLTPPLDVQECFVERAATARGVHARTTAQLQNLDALFAALQQRAFAGEL